MKNIKRLLLVCGLVAGTASVSMSDVSAMKSTFGGGTGKTPCDRKRSVGYVPMAKEGNLFRPNGKVLAPELEARLDKIQRLCFDHLRRIFKQEKARQFGKKLVTPEVARELLHFCAERMKNDYRWLASLGAYLLLVSVELVDGLVDLTVSRLEERYNIVKQKPVSAPVAPDENDSDDDQMPLFSPMFTKSYTQVVVKKADGGTTDSGTTDDTDDLYN